MAGKIHHILCSMWQAAAKRNDRLFRKNADFSGWMSQKEAGFTEKQGNQYQPVTDGLVKVLNIFPSVKRMRFSIWAAERERPCI